jgi:natural product biosynthesis luciferase-like monooxygenase protein
MVEDAALGVIVTQDPLAGRFTASGTKVVCVDGEWSRIAARPRAPVLRGASATDLAYVIYTSGSTGRPKGVLIEHRNATNFFAAMDERIPHDPPGVWLAVTSLSFDISILELLWTLTRGFKVVVHTGHERARARASVAARDVDFSLFYFSSDEGADRGEGYRLLLEGARFADAHGFRAVWTPERHFHAFGGLYPNPAVTGAAIAAITQHVEIRAGSVVLPLHHPIRVAEEWSLVDNLSKGRVGISFASGWQPNDFVLAPNNRQHAKDVMFRDIEIVRRLWRGESVVFPGADGNPVAVRTLPRPIQRELPVWVTSAGNAETFAAAGRIGANVLTHLLGQSVEQLAPKIASYRAARAQAGLDPATGIVSLMLHTFVGEDEDAVREAVRAPLERYLASSMSLLGNHAATFPTLRRASGNGGKSGEADDGGDFGDMDAEEQAALLAHARERYFTTQGLFGTLDRCRAMVERVSAAGVDEIACLIDFGVPTEDVLASLPMLERVQKASRERMSALASPEHSIDALIRREGVTHLQCTPSMAHMLCADPETRAALASVKHVYVGGEALSADLAATLSAVVGGTVTNMYGPTETTIWSTTHTVDGQGASATIPIGRPIANTSCYVLDESLAPLPIGVAGELFLGGDGVARGYFHRPELDAERFLPDRFADVPTARMYRTGDLVRYRDDGVLEFLGRTDHQIKIRGHRIEPGEIEAALAGDPSVDQSVVIAREDTPGDQRLVAYIVSRAASPSAAPLREQLRARLPDYMVPAHFVFLDAIPRTPNGKTDRRALVKPKEATAARASAVLPANELEARLARLWQETLGVEHVGVDDNFFDIGGQSLLIVRMYRRMGEFTARTLSLTDLFRFPTIRSLARFLASDEPARGVEDATSRGRQRRSMGRRRQRAGEA